MKREGEKKKKNKDEEQKQKPKDSFHVWMKASTNKPQNKRASHGINEQAAKKRARDQKLMEERISSRHCKLTGERFAHPFTC